MKLTGNRLKMSDGTIRRFSSSEDRDKFERAAQFFKAHPLKAKQAYRKR